MRAQVTIEHITLSPKMRVTFLEDGADGLEAQAFSIDRDDAEYQLLAQAIDRFVAVQRAADRAAAATMAVSS